MRKFTTFTILALAISFGAATAQAEMGYVSAVHGIPGLDEPVDVYLDGGYLFSFEYGQTFGPAPLPVGAYKLQIRYQGNPVLEGEAMIEEGGSYTAVAYLDETGSIAPLGIFENENSPVNRPTISTSGSRIVQKSRLQVFHLAAAPTVDVSVRAGDETVPVVELAGLSNGGQATAIDILAGQYNVGLLAGDVEVFNTGRFALPRSTNLAVFAVGVYPDSFQLVYLPLN